MSKLDDENNRNLFKLIKFLKFYYLSNAVENQIVYQKLITDYGELVKRINRDIEDYKSKVENKLSSSYQELHIQHNDSFPQYIEMIKNFDSLSNLQQKNVLNLGCFILYCKIYKLDHPDFHHVWRRYSELIEQIKSVSVNQ
ncbi:hypothetical protein [Nostoc sp. 2RC]|uniref:hypothetical protein n=1 Tax=Nostoc sp. 2RC TaxID=2485484 RepID=UPI0017B92B14|nr:hypothetical protein [Nostoc sp. 2RC]MBC1240281.1 hypothetical protein [Nostoc sp. 2RC]